MIITNDNYGCSREILYRKISVRRECFSRPVPSIDHTYLRFSFSFKDSLEIPLLFFQLSLHTSGDYFEAMRVAKGGRTPL